jgi:hypothetical protein
MQAFGVIYTDFQSCASFLKTELNPSDIKATSAMMQGFDFHPDEWQQYSNYQAVFADNPDASGRNQALIAHDDKFAMVLTRWDAEHTGPPIHNCGSKCWIKVLDGQLEENHYNVEVEPTTDSGGGDGGGGGGGGGPPPAAAAPGSRPNAEEAGGGEGEGGEGEGGENYALDLTRTASLTTGSVTFISGLAVHSIENIAADSCSFSLHLYSPPCRGLFCYAHAAREGDDA